MATKSDIERYRSNYLAEQEGSRLYQSLANTERDSHLAELYRRMAETEQRHQDNFKLFIVNYLGVVLISVIISIGDAENWSRVCSSQPDRKSRKGEALALSTASKEGTQQISLQQLFEQLHTSEKGLTSEEARRKLSEVGPNELLTVQRIAGVKQLLLLFTNPLVIILLAASIISAFFGEVIDASIIIVIVLLSITHNFLLILALKRRHHVVGYIGDGINDAPSLHAADVGISVASAVDVAKEAAELILLERGLDVLHKGIIEGRKAFGNVMKYLLMGTSSNFGNMFSMAGPFVFLPFLPMLPTQILLNNFLYDFSQVTIPTDNVDTSYIQKPQRWNIKLIRDFMVFI